MSRSKKILSIWLQDKFPWTYAENLSRQSDISNSVIGFINSQPNQNELERALLNYPQDAIIPAITAAALAGPGIELRERVIALVQKFGEAGVERLILLLYEDLYTNFYRAIKQLRESEGYTSDEASFATWWTRFISLECLNEMLSGQKPDRDRIAALKGVVRTYQSGNYGDGGIVRAATGLEARLDVWEGRLSFHYIEEREARSKAGVRRAAELVQNALEQRRAEENAHREMLEQAANMLTMWSIWRNIKR